MTNQQKCHFSAVSLFIFACRLVLYLYACAVENPEIPGFCVSKSRGLRTDHKRVKKIETSIVLLRRQGNNKLRARKIYMPIPCFVFISNKQSQSK